jgi:hypothetical protein
MSTFRSRLALLAALGATLIAATGCANFPANKPTAVEKQPVQKTVSP